MARIEELLGFTAKDSVTGFTGVITGAVYYLTGCHQLLLIPKAADDNTYKDGQWFDVQRVGILPDVEKVKINNGTTPGADKAPPKR